MSYFPYIRRMLLGKLGQVELPLIYLPLKKNLPSIKTIDVTIVIKYIISILWSPRIKQMLNFLNTTPQVSFDQFMTTLGVIDINYWLYNVFVAKYTPTATQLTLQNPLDGAIPM